MYYNNKAVTTNDTFVVTALWSCICHHPIICCHCFMVMYLPSPYHLLSLLYGHVFAITIIYCHCFIGRIVLA